MGAAAAVGSVAYGARDTSPIPENVAVPENKVDLPRNGKTVLLIGGGLSGLVAGCELIDRGFDVTILEKNATLGGRLRAWRDKSFGVPKTDPDWPGYPVEHGTHLVFNFYRNFRDLMARHGLNLRERPINYPMSAISFAYPNGMFDEREPSTTIAPFHLYNLPRNMNYVTEEENRLLDKVDVRKFLAFDPSNPADVDYLDHISMTDWCVGAGMPVAGVHAVLDPLMDMGNFLPADDTSALYFHRLLNSMTGYWKDGHCFQFFQDSTDETILQPLARHILNKGGKILFDSEVEQFHHEGDKITGVTTKSIDTGFYVCPICGEIHEYEPEHCRRCGYRGEGFYQQKIEGQTHKADYYLLGIDIPGAKRLFAKAPFADTPLQQNVAKLRSSSVMVLYLWYPRTQKKDGEKTHWEDHFGGRECVMTADFPMLGTTMNLSWQKKDSYGGLDADIIETQITRLEKTKGLSDREVAELVDKDLRALIPGLPAFTDFRAMHWDNFTAGTVGAEKHRPDIKTDYRNFLLLGDWVKLEHNCFLMEKVNVVARNVVNHLLDDIGQVEGRMTILETGTPNLICDLIRKTTSVKV